MRIIIPFVLVLVLVFSCALPASADDSLASDYSGNYWIDLLDYGFAFDGSNILKMASGTTHYFKLPMYGLVRSLDIVVCIPRTDCQLYYQPPYGQSMVKLTRQVVDSSKGLYRFYGDVPDWDCRQIGLQFTYSGADSFVEFYQINYSSYSTTSFTSILNGTVHIEMSDYSTVKNPADTTPAYVFTPIPQNVDDYTWTLTNVDWRKYDFLDIRLALDVLTIDSIEVTFNNVALPFEVSYLGGSSYDLYRYVSIVVDVHGLDKSVQMNPYIRICGDCNYDAESYFSIVSSMGLLFSQPPSEDMIWHYDMKYFLDSKINAVISALSPPADTSVGDELVSQGQQIQDYEQSHQNVLQSGVTTLQKSANIGKFSTALAFVGNYATSIFNAMGDFQVVYTLPLTIGLILFLSSRVRGNDKPRKHNDKPNDGTKKSGTTSGNDSVTYTDSY